MSDTSEFKPETLAAQALGWDEPAFQGIIPPIYPSTTYARPADNQGRHGRMYTRDGSGPTVTDCTFNDNTATNGVGGGMGNVSGSDPTVTWGTRMPAHSSNA